MSWVETCILSAGRCRSIIRESAHRIGIRGFKCLTRPACKSPRSGLFHWSRSLLRRLQRTNAPAYDCPRRASVASKLKCSFAIVASICLADLAMTSSASAITVEVAKTCSTLANKAYPPLVAGNPAAGRQNGTAQDLRKYFNKCVANGGNMPTPEQHSNKTDQGSGGSGSEGQPPKETK